MAETKSTRAWQRPLLGPWLLVFLLFQAACLRPATSFPRSSVYRGRSLSPGPRPKAAGAQEYEVEVLEEGAVATRPLPVDREAFQRALQQLARQVRLEGSPRKAAMARLAAVLAAQEEAGGVSAGGDYLAEVSRDRVLSFVPQRQWGAVALTPLAEERLRVQYQEWCQRRGGGDCLGLFDDAAFFLTDDRRALALALALDSVLDETRAALVREVDPRLLVAVLGVSTFWALISGWAHMANRAHEATTFEELREAGQEYARVLGTTAARGLILAVATVVSGPLGQLVARVRAMPVYPLAQAQWRAQGGAMALEEAVALAQEGATAVALQAVEVTATSPQGALAVALLKKGATEGGAAPQGGRTTTVLKHRGGNKQVLTERGERWHLSRDKGPGDIPLRDSVGDQLQEAVTQAAKEWGPHRLSPPERFAIDEARKKGKYWLARLLERQARGRFVEDQVSKRFKHLYDFSRNKGLDIIDPATGYKYEILSGTESNLALHGRRMSSEFFRMLTF